MGSPGVCCFLLVRVSHSVRLMVYSLVSVYSEECSHAPTVQESFLWLVSTYVHDDSSCNCTLRKAALPIVKHKLELLWQEGICHGDVAWRNIVILKGGQDAMLLDLGRAQYVDDEKTAREIDLPGVQTLSYSM
jgi:tRNA A-37 threonylcarbamoyl transferase component Bud32